MLESVSNDLNGLKEFSVTNAIKDPSNPMVTITELEDNSKHYFAVTAFGVEGIESNYSNELCVQVAGLSVTECRSADDGDSGGADSGSG